MHGLVITLTDAAALVAGPGDREESLLVAELTAPAAGRAGGRRRARRGAAATAGLAGFGAGELDRRLGAGRRLLERDLEVVSQVRALLRSATAPAAAEDVAKAEEIAQAAQDVFEAGERGRIEAALRAHSGVAKAIIGPALLRIGEYRVGLGGFLEVLLGVLAALIAVGWYWRASFRYAALSSVSAAPRATPRTS